jgi:hypothetical protein
MTMPDERGIMLDSTILQPEHRLLLNIARVRIDPETAARIKLLLQDGIIWPRLLETARRHGLMPLLYWHLHTHFADQVPQDVLIELHRNFVNNCAKGLALATELVRILKLFEDHGIAGLPFKGPVLGESVYGDFALREFVDLDILIPEPQVSDAEALLRIEGYKPTLEVPQSRLRSFRRMQYEIPYRNDGNLMCIELHWKIASIFFHFGLDMEGVLARATCISLAGNQVRNLSPEDALLILCAHGCKHFWEKLEWICAVAELIRKNPQMNWPLIFGQVHDFGSGRILLLGLCMADDLLGAELPEEALRRISKDVRLRKLAVEAQSRLFRPDPRPITAAKHCLHGFRLTDRLGDGIRIVLRTLFLPGYHDWICIDLPSALSFLYFPIRLFRLLRKTS